MKRLGHGGVLPLFTAALKNPVYAMDAMKKREEATPTMDSR